MIVYESKLEGTQNQYERLDKAIGTGRFVRNSIIRAWIDNQIKSRNDAYKYCKVLADNLEFRDRILHQTFARGLSQVILVNQNDNVAEIAKNAHEFSASALL